jgi:hypothetical protein
MRESRGKAKQYTTINGRTVVVKDAFVYSNKGCFSIFRSKGEVLTFYHRLQDAQPGAVVGRYNLVSRLARASAMVGILHLEASVGNIRRDQDYTSHPPTATP